MAEETLFTAARRAITYFNIDMNKGGIITTDTERAMETLNRMLSIEGAREKQKQQGVFGQIKVVRTENEND